MNADYSVEYYTRRLENLKKKRTNYDSLWQEIAMFCDPKNAYFTVNRTPGDNTPTLAKTDDTFQSCLPMFASIVTSILCPQVYKWHTMRFRNDAIQASFGAFLEAQNDTVFSYRYNSNSGFVTAVHEAWMQAATYGHCILSVTPDKVHKRLNYQCLPVKEFYIDKNASGLIDTLYRKVEYTYRNLRGMFPNYMPERYKDSQDTRWLDEKMELIQVVEPSQTKSKEFDVVYIDMKCREIIEKKTMPIMPIVCGRNMVYSDSDDPYGFSQAMCVLPSIKALNALRFNEIKVSDLMARQTFLAGDDVVNPNQVMSGGIIHGGIDQDGRPMVAQLQYQGTVYPLDKEVEKYQQTIREVLFVSLYLTYQQTQSRSATDAMIKANEKMSLLAPIADRLAREVIAPMIDLEMYWLDQMNLLPEAPDALKQAQANAGERAKFDIIFDNPILKSQKSDAAMGIQQLAQFVAQMAQMDGGESLDLLNTEAAIRELQNILNVPAQVVSTPEVIQQKKAAKAQMMAAQQQMAMVPTMASAAKDFAQAQKLSQA